MWVAGTWAKRGQIMTRAHEFTATHGVRLTPLTAALFVESLTVGKATKASYSGALSATLKLLGHNEESRAPLLLQQRGLRASGATIPTQQAHPATRCQILHATEIAPTPKDKGAILLCRKTASRWADVSAITKSNLFHFTPQEIVVDWLDRTKTSRSDPYRASRYAVIRGTGTETIYRCLRHVPPTEPITTLTTEQLAKLLKQVDPRLSAHSIKHGAMNDLARAAAAGALNPTTIALLAKHKQASDLVSTTIRYVQDRLAAARMLRTQDATKYL
jgi:hypothetical protein